MSDRKWSKTMIQRKDSQWLLFGMPIAGGWLPSAAFNTGISYDDVMNPTEKIKVQHIFLLRLMNLTRTSPQQGDSLTSMVAQLLFQIVH